MSATPIVSSPENVFNCYRFMDSSIFGSINDWNNQFAGPRDRFGNIKYYRNLDVMRQKVMPVTHQADKKTDPDIAAQFPVSMPPETIFCDLDPKTAVLYDILQQEYRNIGKLSILSFNEVLAAIGTFQMLCSNPRSVLKSAQLREEYERTLDELEDWMVDEGLTPREKGLVRREFEKTYKEGSEVALKLRNLVGDDSKFTDEDGKGNCIVSKMLTLRELIDEHDGKCIVFTSMHYTLQPLISQWLTKWDISHVCYPFSGQEGIDAWRDDPNIKVFLSTDAGADSIDLPESDLTIHYDLPWTYAAVTQRENRQHRIDSTMDTVRTITLAVPGTVEDRKAEIIEKKRTYHETLYGGPTIEDHLEPSEADYLFVLTGER
jgi:SNF2 family DNA or RNA helicase